MTEADRNQYKKCLEDNGSMCHLCGRPYAEIHHIFGAANRDKSTKYGMIVPLCSSCHSLVHRDRDISYKLKAEYQEKFEREHPDLDFHKVFGKMYK